MGLHLLQDWRDIDMAIAANVDFICLSFVKSAGRLGGRGGGGARGPE